MGEAGGQIRRKVLFSGDVQGVGFRYTTRSVAGGYDVTGYVRNLPDGRVEVVAEGSPEQVGSFLQAVEKAMSGYIRDRRDEESPARGEFAGFGVRH